MKNRGLFLNMTKRCFLFVCFSGLLLLWFVFSVSGKVAKVLKMLVFFPSFLGFVWWLILVYLGLEGLGVFVFLVFVFLLFRFSFQFFVLFLFCCWIVFGVVLVQFFLFFLVFFGGFKGQVRWPKRATSLGPKPSLFLFFCFLGGFKGQVRWPFPFFALNRKNLFSP